MNAQEHLLVCIAEEADEIATAALALSKACHKALRFSVNDINPERKLSAKEVISEEFNDLIGVVELFESLNGPLPNKFSRTAIDRKKEKVRIMMARAVALGALQSNTATAVSSTEDNLDYIDIPEYIRKILRDNGYADYHQLFNVSVTKYIEMGIDNQQDLNNLVFTLITLMNRDKEWVKKITTLHSNNEKNSSSQQ